MHELFSTLTLADVRHDVWRNIVSLRQSQDLFDDLSHEPSEWRLAQRVEAEVKPPPYRSSTPIIDRPFEDAEWFNAIGWPFKHWQTSRFSDGSYGVWYGSQSIETTVYESAYHWYHGLLGDAGFQNEAVTAERKVYAVACNAALLDFRGATLAYPDLLHPSDYAFPQSVGARIHHEGHPGIVIQSARHAAGENVAVFNAAVLSNPRLSCQLSYKLADGEIRVEKQRARAWRRVKVAELG